MRRCNKPLVRNDLLLTDDADSGTANAIRVGSQLWYAWLAKHYAFIFEGGAGHLTARREIRRGIAYWYGYRRRGGKFSKTYLGKSEELTQERLEQASALLAGQTTPARLSSNGNSVDLIAALNQGDAIIPTAGTGAEMSFLPLTKIKPPALPQKLIARPRLTQRISTPVTLICAPSGFGKSTLLNEWRQTCGMPVAWVALDADDNHPLRFWSTVVTALQTINSNLGRELLPQLGASSPCATSEIVVNLTNEIVRAMDQADSSPRLGLILDDYHHIERQEIHASLQCLLEHLPPTLQLIISSRTKPPLALGRLRAKGMVTELRTDDLRFTLEEGIEFLWQHTLGQRLAYSDMQTLVKRTEGWVTGLTLATFALTQQEDRRQSMATFTGAHTYLREYFMESVLCQQPLDVQAFLLKTAILKHLTGSLCDAVTGQSDGAEMLSRLWQENLFLVRLEEQDWYRYHDLFAEMLCCQLQTHCPAEIPHLHRRAAEWYRTQNAPADAVYHLLAIEAWEEAASLIESMAMRELEQFGEDSRLLRWLQQLPEIVVQQHKTLLAVYVRLARMALLPTEVERFLARTETNRARAPAVEQTRTAQDTLTEVQRIRRLWVTSDLAISELPAGGEHDEVWRMLNRLAQSQCYSRKQVDQAEAMAREVYEGAQARRHLFLILMAGGACATYASSQGHLRRSEKIAHQVLRQAFALRGKLPEPASIALVARSGVCYERNQLAQAHQLLVRATEVDPNPTSPSMPVMVAIRRALIQSAQGDGEAAFATIQAARELHVKRPTRMWLDQDFVAYQALFCLRQGDRAGAERLLSEAGDADTHALSALVRAEILLEQKQNATAEDILSRLLAQYPHGLYWVPILGARVLLALALFEQRKVNQARQVMAEAVRLAGPESFIRPFLDHGPQGVPLLTLVLHTENLTAETQSFVKEVLRMLGHADGVQKSLPKDELMALSTAASISAREQQVLRLVSAGLFNREIAARLSVSESTVKTHLENIYRKLGVSSRTQAIAQAQVLRLV